MNGLTARNAGLWHPALGVVLLSAGRCNCRGDCQSASLFTMEIPLFSSSSRWSFSRSPRIAVCYPRDYAHLFLALMWFVGFWLKFVLHEMFEWSSVEPIGDFAATPAKWDHVLIVCSIGGAGFIVGRLATLPLSVRFKSRWRDDLASGFVFSMARVRCGLVHAAMIVLAVVLNWRFGILCAWCGCADVVAVAAWRLVRVGDGYRFGARAVDPDSLGPAIPMGHDPRFRIAVRGGRDDVAVDVEPCSVCLSYIAILCVGGSDGGTLLVCAGRRFWCSLQSGW